MRLGVFQYKMSLAIGKHEQAFLFLKTIVSVFVRDGLVVYNNDYYFALTHANLIFIDIQTVIDIHIKATKSCLRLSCEYP